MGLNIYFYYDDENYEEVEIESYLQITHNLNKVLIELDKIVPNNYYKLIWSYKWD